MPEISLDDGTQGADSDAIHDNIANEITAISEKTSLDGDDVFVIEDSAASYVKKKVKQTNLGVGGASLPVDEATAIVKKTGDASALARIGATAHIPGSTTIVVHWPSADLDLDNAIVISGSPTQYDLARFTNTTGKIVEGFGLVGQSISGSVKAFVINGRYTQILWDTGSGAQDYVALFNGAGNARVEAGGITTDVDLHLAPKTANSRVKAKQDGTNFRVVTVWNSSLGATQPIIVGTDPDIRASELRVTDGAGFTGTFDISGITKANVWTMPNESGTVVLVGASQQLVGKGFQDASCYFYDDFLGHKMFFELTNLTGDRIITVPNTSDTLVLEQLIQTVKNKRMASMKIWDTSETHFYAIGVNELTAHRTITLPLLTANDTFVFEAFAQVLQSKGLHHSNCYWWDGTYKLNLSLSSFTADRTITVPNATDTMCLLNETQTLANKTLTQPTIADLTNMQHDHSAANKGGALADKYKRRVIPIQVESPADGQEHLVVGLPYASTVKEVTYHCSTGTVNMNFQHRAKTAMGTTTATKLWSSDVTVSTTNVTATSFSGTSSITADNVLTLTFASPSAVGTVFIWLEIEVT